MADFDRVFKEVFSKEYVGAYLGSQRPWQSFFGDYTSTVSIGKKLISVAKAAGMRCKSCNASNEYAEPNQNDGSYLCYDCR